MIAIFKKLKKRIKEFLKIIDKMFQKFRKLKWCVCYCKISPNVAPNAVITDFQHSKIV